MEITQRTANLGDADVLLAWRNNLSVREFSLHSGLIQNDEHLDWLTARLERVHYEPFFLFIAAHEVIGMSRLDLKFESANKYEISILVDPNQHGKGFGTKILNMTCGTFFRVNPDKTILAKVHQDNIISQKLFTNAGFRLTHSLDKYLHFEKSI
jgi:UDP-2,4-diacetamido-2,4,6-trideoxy-beta-L-altropyranose hydrolase